MPGGSSPGTGASSFIKTVDDRDVSTLDNPFELLPGCHLVATESNLVVANENISFRGEIGARVFPFRMKAGYEYAVVVEFSQSMGGDAHVSVNGVERDSTGKEIQTVSAATSADDLRACRAWTAP